MFLLFLLYKLLGHLEYSRMRYLYARNCANGHPMCREIRLWVVLKMSNKNGESMWVVLKMSNKNGESISHAQIRDMWLVKWNHSGWIP